MVDTVSPPIAPVPHVHVAVPHPVTVPPLETAVQQIGIRLTVLEREVEALRTAAHAPPVYAP